MARVESHAMYCHNKQCKKSTTKSIVTDDHVVTCGLDVKDKVCPHCGFATLKISPHPDVLFHALPSQSTGE